MRRAIKALTCLALLWPSLLFSEGWDQSDNVKGGIVNDIAASPDSPGTFFAATFNGFLKSTDNGITWEKFGKGLEGLHLRTLAIDPLNPEVIYIGTYNSGMFKSTDQGASWTKLKVEGDIRAIVIDPKNPEVIYVASYQRGVVVSLDRGRNWSKVSKLPADRVSSLLLLQDKLLAGTWEKGLFSKKLKGEEWTSVGGRLSNKTITFLKKNPHTPKILYAGTYGDGIYLSRDFGKSWQQSNEGLDNLYLKSMAIDNALYVTTDGGGVFKSLDGGISWVSDNNGLKHRYVYSIVTSSNFVLIGTCWGGIYRKASKDG